MPAFLKIEVANRHEYAHDSSYYKCTRIRLVIRLVIRGEQRFVMKRGLPSVIRAPAAAGIELHSSSIRIFSLKLAKKILQNLLAATGMGMGVL